MSDADRTISDRFRTVASAFTQRARSVPDAAWDAASPCEGWTARDVVGHMVEWMPPFLHDAADVRLRSGPSVDVDPVGAWVALSDGIQAVLDDPVVSAGDFDHPQAGRHRVDEAIGMFILGDVLIHTWDVARTAGLDEELDAAEVHGMLLGVEAMGDALSESGQYACRLEVPAGASEQVRLLAATGRRAW
jgi:uncharacterized protein (TIGR03086 family)